jgi:peroxiredoxin
MQLGELQDSLADFHALDTEVWAVDSTEALDKVTNYAQVRGITFPLLVDSNLAVTNKYGVLNEANRKMAYPTTLVIDRKGMIRYIRMDVDFTKRPPVDGLLLFMKKLPD